VEDARFGTERWLHLPPMMIRFVGYGELGKFGNDGCNATTKMGDSLGCSSELFAALYTEQVHWSVSPKSRVTAVLCDS